MNDCPSVHSSTKYNFLLRRFIWLSIFLLGSFLLEAKGQVILNEFVANNSLHKDPFEETDDWIELRNLADTAVNLNGWFLTDDFTVPQKQKITSRVLPAVTIEPRGYLLLWLDKGTRQRPGGHINLKLSAAGEQLGLLDPQGNWIDSVTFGRQRANVSMGRYLSQPKQWGYFKIPTPKQANQTPFFSGMSVTPTVSVPAGFYANTLNTISLKAPAKSKIYYTLNGKDPSEQEGTLYKKPFSIDSSCVLRVAAIEAGKLPSEIVTVPYLIRERNTGFPTVYLALDHEALLTEVSEHTGGFEHEPVHITYFDAAQANQFAADAGIKLAGQAIRFYAQRSMVIKFHPDFGPASVAYPLFSQKEQQASHSLVLRNSGNDWSSTLFRDAFIASLAAETKVDCQAYEPVVVYVNGKYWGISNLREKIDKWYVKNNHPEVSKMDLFEWGRPPIQGDSDHLTLTDDFIRNRDLAIDANYDSVLQLLDLENFIDYQCTEIFIGNADWPMANMKFWRPAEAGGKWRWILFDTDMAFKLDNRHCPGHHNTLLYATGVNNCQLPVFDRSLTWSTLYFRKLLANQRFRAQFVMRFYDLLNTTFASKHVTATIDSFQKRIRNEIPYHIARWGKKGGIRSLKTWEQQVNLLRRYAEVRPDTVRQFLAEYFKLEPSVQVVISAEGQGGQIQMNTLAPRAAFKGVYPEAMVLKVKAIPRPGFEFVAWKETGNTNPLLETTAAELNALTAQFRAIR